MLPIDYSLVFFSVPRFTRGAIISSENKETFAGQTVNLTCSFDSPFERGISTYWTKDGVKIKDGQKVRRIVNTTSASAMISFDNDLLISPLALKDTGVYACVMAYTSQKNQSDGVNITVKRT